MTFAHGSSLLIGALLTLAACQASEGPSSPTPAALAPAGSDQVHICHFRGHESDLFGRDFVTAAAPPGSLSLCGSRGGDVIRVSREACTNGHAAKPSSVGDCTTG